MTFTITPYKLNADELEARVDGNVRLLPEDIVRFEAAQPVYGEVTGLRGLSGNKGDGFLVKFRILLGTPSFELNQGTVLANEEMAREIQQKQGVSEHPMHLGDAFTADFYNLGPLTLIEGPDFVLKYETLMMLVEAIAPHQRVLIIDPLGLFSPTEHITHHKAGAGIRLSMQAVGSKRFLSAFGETFPEALRPQALEYLVNHLPLTQSFIPFNDFKNWDPIHDHPMRNLAMESLEDAERTGIFANTPEEVFSLSRLCAGQINVADLSALAEPWKTLFYEEICWELFRSTDKGIVPALLYPENYLQNLDRWIQKADEAELSLMVLTSPYPPPVLQDMANNSITAVSRDDICLEGTLTSNLPLSIPLQESNLQIQPEPVDITPTPQAPIFNMGPPPEPADEEPEQDPYRDFNKPEAWQPIDVSLQTAYQTEAFSDASQPGPEPAYPEPEPWTPPEAAAPDVFPPAESIPVQASPPPEPGFYDSILGTEEFDFDLNLDEKPETELAGVPEPMASPAGDIAASVNQSMAEFERPLEPVNVGITMPDLSAQPEESAPMWQEVPAETVADSADEEADFELSPEALPEAAAEPEVPPADTLPVYQKQEAGPADGSGYQVGDKVKHETYGVGVINKIIPMDDNVILNINFENGGKRLLDPKLCNLEKA